MRPTPLALMLMLAPSLGLAADNCETIRAQIETKIKAAGVAGFSLTVVGAAASAPGKVVGSCGNGTKKIVYAVGAAAPAKPVITECADGSAPVDGVCRK